MNAPNVTDLDSLNFLLAAPRVFSCSEATRLQPDGPHRAAHDVLTRLLQYLTPDTDPLWQEAEPLIDRTRGLLIIDETTLDTPSARRFDAPNDRLTNNDHYGTRVHLNRAMSKSR